MKKVRMSRKARGRGKERGLTLIEVLVAFFILFVVTLAVLQLLSMAYLVNLGSMVRTELTYKAEQVVETIRLLNFRYYWLQAMPTATELNCCPIGINQSMTISNVDPTYISNNCDQFWGASGANILHSDSRFALDYTINPNLGVTVHAVPLKDANGNYLYLGPVATKVVVYVVQLRNF